MPAHNEDISPEVPEADREDQLEPADPQEEQPDAVPPIGDAATEVSEGDWVEHQLTVPHEEDER